MAKRLIDQAALIEDIEAAEKNAGMGAVVAGTLKRYVKRQPTVDAVEVVRCRDCFNHRKYMGRSMCAKNAKILDGHEVHLTATSDNDFCSYGERRANDELP